MGTLNATIYARVSSEEQVQGYSIDAQLRALLNVQVAALYGVPY
jgi:DNA invertase Pin-like site-specific DNA recombinase